MQNRSSQVPQNLGLRECHLHDFLELDIPVFRVGRGGERQRFEASPIFARAATLFDLRIFDLRGDRAIAVVGRARFEVARRARLAPSGDRKKQAERGNTRQILVESVTHG